MRSSDLDALDSRLPRPDGGRTLRGAALSVEGVSVAYGKRPVLFDVSIAVQSGEIVAILGHNGAGKTTLLKAIFGLLPLRSGQIVLDGAVQHRMSGYHSVINGMSFTPAEAPIFRNLTVRQNLDLGAYTVGDSAKKRENLERVFELFPILKERLSDKAGLFSGGQQRLLSLGIAMMSAPRIMLLDEPSLGIAPSLVERIFQQLKDLVSRGDLTVLLVEQNVRKALPFVDRAYFMRHGSIILEESGAQALARGEWWDLY